MLKSVTKDVLGPILVHMNTKLKIYSRKLRQQLCLYFVQVGVFIRVVCFFERNHKLRLTIIEIGMPGRKFIQPQIQHYLKVY